MRTKVIRAAIAVAVLISAAWSLAPAIAGQKDPYAEKGRKLFGQYCASCHGADAKGKGPVAASLTSTPPDLTVIQKTGEKFPFDYVAVVIDGEKTDRAVIAHGTSTMPVWGTIFRRTKGDLRKEGDVYALTRYIESIQTAK